MPSRKSPSGEARAAAAHRSKDIQVAAAPPAREFAHGERFHLHTGRIGVTGGALARRGNG